MPTTTLPVGATALPYTCWHLIDSTGQPFDTGDCEPHYPTEADAKAETWSTPTTPVQLDAPCYVATTRCGERAGDLGSHFETPEQAWQEATEIHGWTVHDGHLCCDDHGRDCGQ